MQKTKICLKCKKEKLLTDFSKLKLGKNGLNPRCTKCRIEDARERRHKNPEKYRKIGRHRDRQRTIKSKQKAVDYKGGKCQVCGYSRCLAALEFHHINPEEKKFDICSMHQKWKNIKRELDKCILVCANCHREIHHYK